MTTTQTSPETAPAAAKGAGSLTLLLGLAAAPLAFVFGGFAALPAAVAALPPLRRLRPAALAFVVGVAACWGLSQAGINPWVSLVRWRVSAMLTEALGAEPTWQTFTADPVAGTLDFGSVQVELPKAGGSATLEHLQVDAGYAFLLDMASPTLTGRGLQLSVDGNAPELTQFLESLGGEQGHAFDLHIEGGALQVRGEGLSARAEIKAITGAGSAKGLELRLVPLSLAVTALGREHLLRTQGVVGITRSAGRTGFSAELTLHEPELGHAFVHGTLLADGSREGALAVTLDRLELGALWARYRVIDRWRGLLRGSARVTGGLRDLGVVLDLEGEDIEYFHNTAMQLDESRSFLMPACTLQADMRIRDGETVEFAPLLFSLPEGTLATGRFCEAQGSATLTLQGQWPALEGLLDATVTGGRLKRDITWNPLEAESLLDLEPNTVLVGEQFPALALDWKVNVQRLDVDCAPLAGWLTGALEGTFDKPAQSRAASVRAGGKLALKEGRFAFLAAAGDVTGELEFNPHAPVEQATLRGALAGKAGSVPLQAEITGSVWRPGFVFSGVTMTPEALGRCIYQAPGEALAPAQELARREACTRLCGPAAAVARNPFLAKEMGLVFFSFKP
ncbi:MAG: hypothetical protein IT463_03415 [Planctomycetes bacterium]|nr:hypothetical protein [Planctomycetota bacterium]